MAGSSIIVVEAGRRPVEMNESLLVKSVFVARPIGLNEKALMIQPIFWIVLQECQFLLRDACWYFLVQVLREYQVQSFRRNLTM